MEIENPFWWLKRRSQGQKSVKKVFVKILNYDKRTGNKKALCEWINHLHRVFLLSWKNFQRPQDAQPSPEGTILGAWGNPSTSIFAGAIRLKSQNMYMFALLANL